MKRTIMWLTVVGAAGIVAAGAGYYYLTPRAPKYDDPAVAVCEWLTLHQDVTAAQGYRRVSAMVSGNQVALSYVVSALNTEPQAKSKTCAFFLDQGTYRIKELQQIDCSSEEFEVTAANKDVQFWQYHYIDPDKWLAIKARASDASVALGICHDRVNEQLAVIGGMERALSATGVYPIDPTKTKLSSSP